MNNKTTIRSASDTIGNLLNKTTRDFGSLPEIVDQKGSVTYAEIDAAAARIARGLLASGVTKGARVGILMPNGQDFLAALFGVTRIGGVAVLLSTLSRGPELAHMIRNSDMDTLLTVDQYLKHDYVALLEDALPALRDGVKGDRLLLAGAPFLRNIWFWGDARPKWARGGVDDLIALADTAGVSVAFMTAAQNEVVAADPALTIYTSGSTAEPKAVVHSQGSAVRQGRALSDLSGCGVGDRLLTTLPFFWVGGLCTVVLSAICSGTTILCPEKNSTEVVIHALRHWQATHIMQWPHQITAMQDRPEFQEAIATLKPAYSTQLNTYGMASSEHTPNSLGMTETLGPHSMHPLVPLEPDRIGSFGSAVGGIEHRIIDPKTGKALSANKSGTLSLRGGALMIGLHRKELAEIFDSEGFYRTDDICYLSEDGQLFFTGRNNDLLKISGANVSAAEVERALLNEPEIKSVCVLALPDDKGVDRLVAALVLNEGKILSRDELKLRLKKRLSSYKIPRSFFFLENGGLPMTATFKIDKPALRRLLASKLAQEPGKKGS